MKNLMARFNPQRGLLTVSWDDDSPTGVGQDCVFHLGTQDVPDHFLPALRQAMLDPYTWISVQAEDSGLPGKPAEDCPLPAPGAAAPFPESLARLALAVPPMLEAALGYPGRRRFVALLSHYGELAWCDGQITVGGVGDAAFLHWLRHPSVAPVLAGIDIGIALGSETPGGRALGDPETRPAHALLLDRRERHLWAGPRPDALAFLRRDFLGESGWQEPVATFLDRRLQELLAPVGGRESASPAEIGRAEVEARQQAQEDAERALCAWLDRAEEGEVPGCAT